MMTGLIAMGVLTALFIAVVWAGVKFMTWVATPKRPTKRR
jgi:hypothetical protein